MESENKVVLLKEAKNFPGARLIQIETSKRIEEYKLDWSVSFTDSL